MKISQKGLNLIKEFEGCYLTAYKDPVNVWTIGYGTTSDDKAVTGKTIKEGMKISQATADKWLEDCLNKIYAPKVMKYDDKYHWNQNQFDSLLSFCYNIGNIDKLTANGTRSINQIASKILEYNKAGGKELYGLTRRRVAERTLFITPVAKKGYSGKLPKLPKCGYYKYNDGITCMVLSRPQIRLLQLAVNWATGSKLKDDGKYGKKTVEAVKDLQRKKGLPVNGCYGNKCQEVIKTMKK